MLERFPTTHLPDYAKLDLAVGLPEVHPLAQALDRCALTLSEEALSSAYRAHPDRFAIPRVRTTLDALGFPAATLTDEEAYGLFDNRNRLLSLANTLEGIRALALPYLGATTVRRGRPLAAAALPAEGARELCVADDANGSVTVFVRCEREPNTARVAAFRTACRLLVTDGVDVVVAPPLRKISPEARGFSLGAPNRLSQRRL